MVPDKEEKKVEGISEFEEFLEEQPDSKKAGSSDGEESDEGDSKKKKKKKKKKKQTRWILKIERTWLRFKTALQNVLFGIASPDGPTRRMSTFFFVSLFVLIGVSAFSWEYLAGVFYRGLGDSSNLEQAKQLGDFFGKQKEMAEARVVTLSLGTFSIELKPNEFVNQQKKLNVAEVELSIACDSKTTCEYIKTHLSKARDNVIETFLAVARDVLMSDDGKRKIKTEILYRLNFWLPKGKVKQVYFTQLLIS